MIATIVLIILLTQSKTFDFLTETYLGRLVLLTFVLFISYCNQMAGLFAVLCVIISYNYYDMYKVKSYNYDYYENNSYYEGFDVSRNNVNISDMSENRMVERDISGNQENSTSIQNQLKQLKLKENVLNQKLTTLNNSEKNTEKNSYYEGFDVSRNNVNTRDMSGNRMASGNMSGNRMADRDVSGNQEDATSIQNQLKQLKIKENILNQKLTSLKNSDSDSDSENNMGKKPSRFEGKEGFCMPERELNILRGKQSNTIPVMNVRNKCHTEPSDKSSFISDFAIF
jgi:hypothetical protein